MRKEISKEIGKLGRKFMFTIKFVSYQEWKKRVISLFSEVHDKETLARILRSRKKVAEKNSKLVDTIFIGGAFGTAINDNLYLFMSMGILQILIVAACAIVYVSTAMCITGIFSKDICFYDECLAILDSLCQSNTK